MNIQMGDKSITQCDQEAMLGYWFMLAGIITDLNEAYEKADSLLEKFDEAYEGEAKEEADIFLTNMPRHIYRLEMFYAKMMEFIQTTAESLLQNDIAMTENMEK